MFELLWDDKLCDDLVVEVQGICPVEFRDGFFYERPYWLYLSAGVEDVCWFFCGSFTEAAGCYRV